MSIFTILNYIFFTLVALICLLPYLHIISKSFSSNTAVVSGNVAFWPIGFQLDVYDYVLKDVLFWKAFRNSVVVTILGTVISMTVTILAAYPLSKHDFRGRKVILMMYIFSMLFYGGTIPIYIFMQTLGLLNTLYAIIIPNIVVQYNLFVLKTFFEELPDEIEESAQIDGAGQLRALISIVLPISLPCLATIGLFYAVGYWNNYYHAMLFITKPSVKPMQLYLSELIRTAAQINELEPEMAMNLSSFGIQAGSIIAGTLPILILYPFAQKYFVTGLTLGSVKG